MNNLLAQGQEIKRIKKEDERRQKVAQEEELERAAEEKQRAVEEFEKTMMGLEGGDKKNSKAGGIRVGKDEELERAEGRGLKRKFELDEDEMLKNAKEERAKARKALDDEKVAIIFSSDCCSWLTRSSPQSQPCPPFGFRHLHHLQITRKTPSQSNSPHCALLRPLRTSIPYRSSRLSQYISKRVLTPPHPKPRISYAQPAIKISAIQ